MEQLIKMIEEQEENIEWGTLTLQIYCSKCESIFELNTESISMHMIVGASIWDYIKWIQLSKCTVCTKKELESESKENI